MIKITSHLFESTAKKVSSFLIEVARLSKLAQHFFYWSFAAPLLGKRGLRRHSFVEQLVFAGNESLFIVLLVAA